MTAAPSTGGCSTNGGAREWLGLLCRAAAAALLLPAGAIKFLRYDARAAVFADLGVPAADVTVLLVGGVELAVAVALAVGAAGRLAALVAAAVMLAAVAFAGLAPANVVVLAASVGVLALGPGKYALREPEPIERLARAVPVGS